MNTNQPVLLSFVLPIYNVEKYLEECVDSILPQMTEDCEIILVDDGAKDSSGAICDRYAERDPRIRVIHKENGGLSSARNAGLLAARGEYVTFVDSDDKIYSESVPKLLEWISAKGGDMCFLQAEKFFPDGTRYDLGERIRSDGLNARPREEAIAYLTSRPKYPGSAWAKLYRRSFLLENDCHFPYDRRYSEDLGFIRDCILCAQSFDALEMPFYQYRKNREGSITSRFSLKNFNDLALFVSESCEVLTVQKADDPVSKMLMSFVSYEYAILLLLYGSLSKEERKAALPRLKEYSWTLRHTNSKKGRVISLICKLFGVRFTAFVIMHYRRATQK